MKTLILFLSLTALNVAAKTQNDPNTGITITVTVPNVTSEEGAVLFVLHDKDSFITKAPIKAETAKIINGVATITFTNVPAGEYGITCLHDTNNNQRMDYHPNGMPKENYGVSNNPMSYGPPMWDDAKFEVGDKNMSLIIRL